MIRASVSGNMFYGVSVFGVGGTVTSVDIAESTLASNNTGVAVRLGDAAASARVSVHASLVADNPGGVTGLSDAGGILTLTVSDSAIANNGSGIVVEGTGAKAWASGNSVTGNYNVGMMASTGAVFESAQNNAVRDNTTDVTGVAIVPMQ
jgi:hypothetical protein